jgi:hypothetical protein
LFTEGCGHNSVKKRRLAKRGQGYDTRAVGAGSTSVRRGGR